MRRIAVLTTLVLLCIVTQPIAAQTLSTDDRLDWLERRVNLLLSRIPDGDESDRIGELEDQVSLLELKLSLAGNGQLPSPLTFGTSMGTGDVVVLGGMPQWAGTLPPDKTFYLWCVQFRTSPFELDYTVGLHCGWTPGP